MGGRKQSSLIQAALGMQRASYLIYCQPVCYVPFIRKRPCYFKTKNQNQKIKISAHKLSWSAAAVFSYKIPISIFIRRPPFQMPHARHVSSFLV